MPFMNTPNRINTPRGSLVKTKNGTAHLTWTVNFKGKWGNRYNEAQKEEDRLILEYCEPYIPKITSFLIQSGYIGTVLGSGVIKWVAKYAQKVYYQPNPQIGRETGPLRGRLWFDRMKADKGQKLIKEVRARFGRFN